MLNLIGTTVLTAMIVVNLYAASAMMPTSSVQKLTTVTIAGLWVGFAIALGGTGIYASTATPTPVPLVGVMLVLPLVAIGGAALLSARVRETLLALPLPLLLGLNALRILPGVFILLLASQGKLSGPFPQSAGWGDIIVGVTAIPLMLVAARNFAGSRHALLAWNILGTLDLVKQSCSACCRHRDRRNKSLAVRSAPPRCGRCHGRPFRQFWCRSTSSPTASFLRGCCRPNDSPASLLRRKRACEYREQRGRPQWRACAFRSFAVQ